MGSVVPILLSPSADRECPFCGFVPLWSPARLELPDAKRLNDLITHNREIKKGGLLHYAGKPLRSLYVVRTGFMKTITSHENGKAQVTGFSMPGDLIGLDAIETGRHLSEAVALEDSSLCGLRYVDFEDFNRTVPASLYHFHRLMSAKITHDQELMFLLGSMNATERVAAFLLSMSKRFAVRGYSGTRFRLPMMRVDIASYIGIKLETVCRVFSDFQRHGIIAIRSKEVELRNLVLLKDALETNHPLRRTRNIGNAHVGSSAVSISLSPLQ